MRFRRRMIRLLAGTLCFAMLLQQAGIPAEAMTVPGLEEEISEEEKKEAEARAEAAHYQNLYDELQEDLDTANAELDALLDEITEVDRQLADAKDAVELYTQQSADNAELLAEQKETMAKRIQYMYEHQTSTFWEVLIGAKSLAEVLNSADYIRSLSEYDNKMMEEYKATLAESERLKEESLRTEEAVLALQAELADKHAEMDEKVQGIVDKMSEFQELINESEAAAEKFAAAAAQKKSELEELKLAIRRAEEEAARKAAEEARRKAEAEAEAARKAAEEAARKKAEEEAARRRAEEEEARRKAEEAEAARKKAEAEAEAARKAAEEEARRQAEEEARRKEEEAAKQETAEDPGNDPGEGSSDPGSSSETQPPETTAAPETPSKPSNLRWALNDARGTGSVNIDPNAVNPTGYTNLELLASILECECGGQSYEAQVAVANVIYNRILDPHFQTTLYDVIMGVGQFTPVDNGSLAVSLAKGARQVCVDIARDCINGARSIDTRWLFFCTPNSWNNNPKTHTEYMVLGGHVFYY